MCLKKGHQLLMETMKKKVDYCIHRSIQCVTGLCFLILLSPVFISCSSKPESGSSTASNPSIVEQGTAKPDLNKLVGRWLRPDGGYILEIKSASPDGKLDVGYFNPNPIHVARAEWVMKDSKRYVLVELQDTNYPGSTYGLEYKAGTDHLVGTYYQALEKSTFDVEFVREK
jgi:hypothetical protein